MKKQIAILALLVVRVAMATTATTVTQTLYGPDLQPVPGGVISISFPFVCSLPDGRVIESLFLNVPISSQGVFTVNLAPTDVCTPSGTSYSVLYSLPNGITRAAETWTVPSSGSPIGLSSVVTFPTPVPSFVVALSALGQGGATTGQCVVWSGTSWAPASCGTLPNIVTPGTNTKITYNAQGLVTAGAQAQFTDIGGSLGVSQTPLTTSQDILYRNAGGVLARLPIVSVNACLGNTAGAWASITCNGTVINDVTLTNNQLVGGAGTTHVKVVDLSGDITTSGGLAATLATVNSGPGACGDSTHVCQVTTNGKGLVTAQATVAIAKTGTSFITWGSIANGACSSSNVTVTGATAGAAVAPQWPGNFPASFVGTMVVDTTSDVLVTICNLSGGPVTPSGGLYGASVLQ